MISRRFALLGAALVFASQGCKAAGQRSAEAASVDVQRLVALTERDVLEVQSGLPRGAEKLGDLLAKSLGGDADPKQNLPAVRTALLKMRQQVPDLGIAKSTFFALGDPKGVAIRNDFEHDTMAGKDLIKGWPGLAPVLEGTSFVSTTGHFPGTPNPSGPDGEWVAAVPVKKADGTAIGILVTGWTYRRFAYHLQVSLQRDLQDDLLRTKEKGHMPLVYVCLFDREHVYGAGSPGATPVPPANEEALAKVGLFEKTEAGPASSPIALGGREFGWAAARLPKLGSDVGVVVLRSEI